MTLRHCIQEAEQSFVSELAALARVPLAESRPFSSKRGSSGKSWKAVHSSGSMGPSPVSATNHLCGLGHRAYPLRAFVSLPVNKRTHLAPGPPCSSAFGTFDSEVCSSPPRPLCPRLTDGGD